jgi:hypothetical protein
MRGHENIIALRVQGKSPKIVFLNDYPCKTDWFENSDHATVCTDNNPISSLDLRFLVGLTVSISASSEGRAKALFAKAKQFGAKTVAACHVQPDKHQFEQSGWAEVFRKEEV